MKGENLKPVIYSHTIKKGTPSQGTFTHTTYLKNRTRISGRLVFRPNTGEFDQEKSFTERVLSVCANMDEDSPPRLPQGLHLPLPSGLS